MNNRLFSSYKEVLPIIPFHNYIIISSSLSCYKITKQTFPIYKIKIPMALAILSLLTTIFLFSGYRENKMPIKKKLYSTSFSIILDDRYINHINFIKISDIFDFIFLSFIPKKYQMKQNDPKRDIMKFLEWFLPPYI